MSSQKDETSEEDEAEERRSARPFPKHALEEALVVAQAIQDKNAGKPMKRIFVAEAIGRKPGSSEFKKLLSSSFKYGLTLGTEKSEYIELTALGQSITKPKNPEERMMSLQQAALGPELFKRVYQHYKDAKIPSGDFFKNVLEREFGVPREWIDECVDILLKNGSLSEIIREISGSPYVVLGEPKPAETTIAEEKEAVSKVAQLSPLPTVQESAVRQIFIGHGKNKEPLEQLKAILDQFRIPYKVAVDEPHEGRPISEKVAELMKSCSSAIFVFTADEEVLDIDGNKTYRPSDNVVYELGAATVLYGRKIVIFREEGVTFASDFRDFGYIPFEKDKLNATAMYLIKELVGLGFVKITPA
jgi:predicted nucleotide-binding protein